MGLEEKVILRAVVLGAWIALSLSTADEVPGDANQPSAAFVFGDEWHLVNEEEHPWCGFGRMEDAEVGYVVAIGDDDAI